MGRGCWGARQSVHGAQTVLQHAGGPAQHALQASAHTRACPLPAGVRPSHLSGAPGFEEVQKRVVDVLKGRVVVGHAITNDLQVSPALCMLCALVAF